MSTDLWSLKPFTEQPLPQLRTASWPVSRVDHFILARLERAGLSPNPDADGDTLLRRLSYDLIGLPPSLEEMAAFEKAYAADPAASLGRVVDRLLASSDFGARWGRHWLDVARYAESSGNTRNMAYVEAWRYRNYVVRAFNRNVPFDQFIREQLAGDLLPAATQEQRDEQLLATGFLAIGTKSLGEQNLTAYELNLADDLIDATCRAFLGLSANCARCHDHKFDPIPTRDYYALAGIFRSTRLLSYVETNNRKEEADGMPLGVNGVVGVDPVKRHEEKLEAMRKDYIEVANKRSSLREALTKAGFYPAKKLAVDKAIPAEVADKLKQLGSLDQSVEDWKARIKVMKENTPKPPALAMAAQERARGTNSPLYFKGDAQQPQDVVPRGVLSAVPIRLRAIGEKESGRRQLADWIASPGNPLTARVIVNRVWHHLFGRGLVETPDDFGRQGARPSHPELLDDLAARFAREGWNVKALIRELTLSRTYRLSSDLPATAATADPDNVLLWRAPRKLLEAEPLRDTILLLSGGLRREMMEGSPVKELAENIKPQSRELGRGGFLNKLGDTHEYRSVYLPVLRGATLPVQQCFDVADPIGVVGARRANIVPTQALYLMNSDFVMKHADGFAKRLLARPAASVEDRLTAMWRMTFARPPTPAEIAKLKQALGSDPNDPAAWARMCQVLIMAGEFRTLY